MSAWFLLAGCQPSSPAANEVPPDAIPKFAGNVEQPREETGKGAVELPAAVAELDPESGIVKFNIEYRFTSGPPRAFYLVEIAFPGTDRYGVKPIDAPELETAGTITTLIEVGDAPVDEFEIKMSEATSPDQGYYLISDLLKGHVVRPAAAAVGDDAPSESAEATGAGDAP